MTTLPTRRAFASVSLSLATLALVGCAADAPQPHSGASEPPAFALDHELAVKFHALTIVECNDQAVRCLIAHPLRPASCSLQLADCLASQAVEEVVDLADCTLENAGCTVDAVSDVACEDLVDCQQDLARCVSDSVDDLTGIDVDPILDELDPYGDEVGETCGEVVVVVGEVVDVAQDAAADAVDNALDALACARTARACVRKNPLRWLPCQTDYAACNAAVAAAAAHDVADTVGQTGEIVSGVVDDAVDTVRDSLDCAVKYRTCRSKGGDYWSCSDAARACELEAL
jgi:hypothetical protein